MLTPDLHKNKRLNPRECWCIVEFFLIFLCVCTNLGEAIIVKKQGETNQNGRFVFNSMMAFASMLFFIFINKGSFDLPYQIWFYILPSAVCYCVALICTYLALSCGSFAFSNMILSYSIVFPIVYGIAVIDEKASIFTFLGFAVMAVSLYLTRGDTKGEDTKFTFKWLFYILAATAASGFFTVIKKMQQLRFKEEYDNQFMIFSLGISAIVMFVIGIVREGGFKAIVPKNIVIALSAGFFNGVTNLLTLIINTLVAISISSPINTAIKIILSFLISAIFLHEKFLKRQIVGVALGTVALVLLNF